MATQTLKRQLEQIVATYSGTISLRPPVEITNKFYIPLLFDDFAAPDLTITGVAGTTGAATKLTAGAGKFDNVRVGDIIKAVGTGTITAPSTFTRTCNLFQGLPYIVYAHTFNSSTLGVKVGDVVTSTSAGSGAVVDRIDYVNRRIFLTANSTATASETVTFAPPTRVTAVRTSTATSNPNEIDIDGSVTATVSGNATIQIGARDAISAVLRVEPVDNTTGARASYAVGVALLDGKSVIGDASGINGLTLETLSYSSVGSFNYDADGFLVNARLPKPTVAS